MNKFVYGFGLGVIGTLLVLLTSCGKPPSSLPVAPEATPSASPELVDPPSDDKSSIDGGLNKIGNGVDDVLNGAEEKADEVGQELSDKADQVGEKLEDRADAVANKLEAKAKKVAQDLIDKAAKAAKAEDLAADLEAKAEDLKAKAEAKAKASADLDSAVQTEKDKPSITVVETAPSK